MPEQTVAEFKYLVERQREEIKALNEVGRLISQTTDPQETVRLAASYLKQTFPLALCAVLITQQRRLQLIQYVKVSQVDFVTMVRQLCTKANESLRKDLLDEGSVAQTVEDQSGNLGWSQTAISLRSSHLAPLAFNGQVMGLLGVFSGKAEAFSKEERHVIDIVADQLGAALRNALLLEELRQANQLKNELLMVISHELRIPLTSIREGTSLIMDGSLGPLNADQQDFLKTVSDNTQRLEALVEKVVTATHLVTGQLKLTLAELDLTTTLRELEEQFRPMAEAKKLSLEFVGLNRPARCVADAARIKRALANVIENAIQATMAEGLVTIVCTPGTGMTEIQVKDTGVGIPAEDLPRLFEQFRFVGGVDDRKTGGLGLGLFITRTFVEAHGGTIKIDSQVNQGTKVTVQVPAKPPERSEADKKA